MRGWVKGAVTAAVVLSVGGWIAEPYVQDWVLIREACDGAMPQDAVEQLVPEDAHLNDEESRRTAGLGSYSCGLTLESHDGHDEGDRFVMVDAYTRRDDQDREFMATFPEEGFSSQTALPDGLPGFHDQYGAIKPLLPCPDLGKDASGRQHKLLVRTTLGRQADSGVPGAAYKTAVALTNAASDKLGCGAERLAVPEKDIAPDLSEDHETVPLSGVKDTRCGWVAGTELPRDAGWRVAVRMNDVGPTGRCDLSAGGEAANERELQLAFLAWYGDWSNRRLASHGGHGESRSMTATARCDGEAANYALSAADDIPGGGEAAQRRMLEALVRDEAGRRDCSDLRFSF